MEACYYCFHRPLSQSDLGMVLNLAYFPFFSSNRFVLRYLENCVFTTEPLNHLSTLSQIAEAVATTVFSITCEVVKVLVDVHLSSFPWQPYLCMVFEELCYPP